MLITIIVGILTGCAAKDSKNYQSLEDFAQARIGIMTGSSQELIVKEKFPEAERVYFSSPVDMVIAVEQGKIDGYMFGSPFLAATIWENAKVKRLDEAVDLGEIAFAFPQDSASDALREQLNEVLATLTPREAKVLSLRFGIEDGRPRTLEEVGKEFNVTRERIRQIEAKALRKLRHPSRNKKLKDFLD